MTAAPGTRTAERQITEVRTASGFRTPLEFIRLKKTVRIDLALEPGQCRSACGFSARRPVGSLGPRCMSRRTGQLTTLRWRK
jgi:hypothetical protein